jgi:hypothetical protein
LRRRARAFALRRCDLTWVANNSAELRVWRASEVSLCVFSFGFCFSSSVRMLGSRKRPLGTPRSGRQGLLCSRPLRACRQCADWSGVNGSPWQGEGLARAVQIEGGACLIVFACCAAVLRPRPKLWLRWRQALGHPVCWARPEARFGFLRCHRLSVAEGVPGS